MSHLVYPEWKEPAVRRSKTPISQWETHQVMGAWRVHLEARHFLEFMSRSGNWQERRQAEKELLVCARKMAFWEKHPGWSRDLGGRELARVSRQWGGTPLGERN